MRPSDGHRLLFTGDSNYLFVAPAIERRRGPGVAQVVHDHIDLLAGSGVDTYLVNPNAQTCWNLSRAWPTVLDNFTRGDRSHFIPQFIADRLPEDQWEAKLDFWVAMYDALLDLQEAGIDWVAEAIKACRRRGISPWATIRMNDMHGAYAVEGSFLNSPIFKRPGMRLSGWHLNPADGPEPYWQALNFELAEVRDFTMLLVREMVDDYDTEGLELDWLRNPNCCEPGALQQTIDIMTDWVGQVRSVTQAKAARTGKPFPLGMRLPANLDYLRDIGLDVRRMAQRGMLDFVSFSNFYQTTWDIDYPALRRELGDAITIYAVTEDSANWMPARSSLHDKSTFRHVSAEPAMLRANAAGKLVMGADGIECFNYFCTDQAVLGGIPGLKADYAPLATLADLAALRPEAKHYTLSSRRARTNTQWWEAPTYLPMVIEPDAFFRYRIPMCAEAPRPGLRLTVQVVVENKETPFDIGVALNGAWPTFGSVQTDDLAAANGPLDRHVPEHTAFNFALDPALLRDGWNEITVLNNDHCGMTAAERLAHSARVVGLDVVVQC